MFARRPTIFLVRTKLLLLHGCDVMCFEVMCLWFDVPWSDVASCEVICGELLWLFATCDVMCCHVISCHVISWCSILSLSLFYYVMLRVVRCCHVIWCKVMSWKWIGRNGVGLGRASCRKPSFCCWSALSRSAVVTPRAVIWWHNVVRCQVAWGKVMWLGLLHVVSCDVMSGHVSYIWNVI